MTASSGRNGKGPSAPGVSLGANRLPSGSEAQKNAKKTELTEVPDQSHFLSLETPVTYPHETGDPDERSVRLSDPFDERQACRTQIVATHDGAGDSVRIG
jgi:hypothetical protein